MPWQNKHGQEGTNRELRLLWVWWLWDGKEVRLLRLEGAWASTNSRRWSSHQLDAVIWHGQWIQEKRRQRSYTWSLHQWQCAMFENLPTIRRSIQKLKHQFQLNIAQLPYPLRNQTNIDENCMETYGSWNCTWRAGLGRSLTVYSGPSWKLVFSLTPLSQVFHKLSVSLWPFLSSFHTSLAANEKLG